MTFFDKYLKGALAYGALRKFCYLYGSSYVVKEVTDDKKEVYNKYPIMATDYLICCSCGALTSIACFAPFYLLNDIKYLEIKSRNLNPDNYKLIDMSYKKEVTFKDLLFDPHLKFI